MVDLDLSCKDWETRLREGRSLVPDLPWLDAERGARAVRVFNKLRLADVPGTPQLEDACGDWFRDIVRALYGSLLPIEDAPIYPGTTPLERHIRELFLLVPKKNSKALALDTPIATPAGFTTMGALRVGDLVIDADGKPTAVLAKSEVFTGHRCYEVEFSTGETVVCDAEHLWVTDAHTDRERQPRAERSTPRPTVKTTAEIASRVTVPSGEFTISNHRTALCAPLELPEADLPIPPYTLGMWLGDGATHQAVITAGPADADHIVQEIAATGQKVAIRGYDRRSGAARISLAEAAGNEKLPYRFRSAAVALGVFGNKHIPALYLRASYFQRLRLLRGLMDSDGSISEAGQASYTTTLPALRDDVLELVNSLGFKGSGSERRAILNGVDHGPCWTVQFWPFDGPTVATIPRKVCRQRASAAKNAPRSRSRQIVAVREVPSVPTQCVMVASETHQFLITRSLIPTHNTTYGALLMLTALLLNERPYAPFMMTAPVHDVAEIAFQAAQGAILLDPVLKAKFHIRDHLKTIVHRETRAELQIITFEPKVVTGQKCVGALIDELHVSAKMSGAASAIRQMRGGMIPFPEAFLAFITTQSEEQPAGVFKAELEKARSIRDGKLRAAMLPVLYEFPVKIQTQPKSGEPPWQDPKIWSWVTPNAGRSLSIKRLEEDMATAKATSLEEFKAWASQHLNVQIGIAIKEGGWVGGNFWEAQGEPAVTLDLDFILAECEVVVVGIDGGGLEDLLGLCVIGRHKVTGHWYAWHHAWMNPPVLERNKAEGDRLMGFVSDGDLTLCEKVGEDVDELAAIVGRIEKSGLLDSIGVDPSGIGGVLDALEAEGVPSDKIKGVSQGWKLHGAIKTTERKLAEGVIIHAGRPLMSWCVGNAKTVATGNAVLITKQISGSAKIDPLMAMFDAVTLMALNPKPPQKKTYRLFAIG